MSTAKPSLVEKAQHLGLFELWFFFFSDFHIINTLLLYLSFSFLYNQLMIQLFSLISSWQIMEIQDIPSTSHVLANLIQVTLEPMSPQPVRLEALQKIEDFKNNSPLCAQCGLFLVRCSDYSHIVRHTG